MGMYGIPVFLRHVYGVADIRLVFCKNLPVGAHAIRQSSNLNIICIVGKDEETEQHFIKALEKVERHLSHEDAVIRLKSTQ